MKLFPAQISAMHTVQSSTVQWSYLWSWPVLLWKQTQVSLQLCRSDSQENSKHGAGQGPGGPGDQHHERQRGQDHGEGGQVAGPGEQGRTAAGRLPAVPGGGGGGGSESASSNTIITYRKQSSKSREKLGWRI